MSLIGEKRKRTRAYSPRPNARKSSSEELITIEQAIESDKVIVGDCLHLLKKVPSRTVDLVILDPPYWKVVGESWDYKWRTEEDYRQWCRLWFEEVARVCKQSASVYLFGYVRNLAYLIRDVCDFGFEFRQEIIVDKGIKSIAGRKTSTYKQFPNTTETIFFFVYDAKPAIRSLLLARQQELGLSSKEINQRLGVKTNGGGVWSLYTGNNILAQVPTLEMWQKLENVLDFEAPDELKGFVFNQQMGLTNVWSDVDFYSENRIHRTQKPKKLIERLILASTKEGHVVLDPFCGSGTTVIAANNLGRSALAFELDPEIAAKANERIIAEKL
ncbi:site-specific DNA-methyltransferase [Frateuria sp. Soil773]|uniref:DNA-methyltransferase n=1 Tax=Frateuria sp. Soil773 TaxID=1736407 RepID=UPI000A8978F5|nr:site-specific DNA-methyltransferase [Frateuria sp. Soil773]